jgi:hypothetical protein
MLICIHDLWNSSLGMESGNPDRIFVFFLITIGICRDSISNYATAASWQHALVLIRYIFVDI